MMSYCLNPDCPCPQNPDDARYCQSCGAALWLRDRYLPLQLLGQGGFGRTILAHDRQADPGSDRPCVIKQLFSTRLTPEAGERFAAEAQRLKDLGHHPQIPTLIDAFEQDQHAYLVQEFIAGENLAQQLARQGSWSETQVRSLLLSLLPVLTFIHGAQVIHRDIKPENIILERTSQRFFLVDFGAAKQLSPPASHQTGTVIGSAAYAAPEQALGRAELASDIYSLGVTCLHLLTGEHPFDLYSIAADRWLWHPYVTQPISSRLTYVLNKMTRRAVQQRYATAEAVLADLTAPIAVPRRRSDSRRSLIQLKDQLLERFTTAIAPAASPPRPPQPPHTWQLRWQQTAQTTDIDCLVPHPTQPLIATGHSDGTIRWWDRETGRLELTWGGRPWWGGAGHQDRIRGLVMMPEGQTLVSSSDDGTIKLWDFAEQRVIRTLQGQGWRLTAIARDATGALLVTGGSDGQVTLWDWQTGHMLQQVHPHGDRITGLAVAVGQPWVISSSTDATIQIWDGRSGAIVNTLTAHQGGITSLAISATGQYLVSGSEDGTVKTWLLPTGALGQTLAKHRDRITAVTISPDATWLASGSEDGQVLVWSVATGALLDTLPHTWGVQAIAAGDERTLITASLDETLRRWDHV